MNKSRKIKIQQAYSYNLDCISQAVAASLRPPAVQYKASVVCAISLGAMLLAANPLQAATFTVTNTYDAGIGSLRRAIASANARPGADDIVFNTTVTGSIRLKSGELEVTDPLIITGPGASQLAIDGKDSSRIFNNQSDLDISGLAVTGGRSFYNYLRNFYGGGIINTGNLTITNSAISGNNTDFYAGGIYNTGSLKIINSIISDNAASRGGGIDNRGDLTVSNSTISNNRTSGSGGGIHNTGSLAITNSIISGHNIGESGGGIFNQSTETVTINDSTIIDNAASRGGGIANRIYYNAATVTIKNSTISGNSADVYGGGIYNQNDGGGTLTLTIDNSTISGNGASYGGGIRNSGSGANITVTNSTITDNAASIGGGIYNTSNAGVSMSNTIIANQRYSTDCHGTIMSNGYNLDSNGSCNLTQPTDLSNTDPLLGPLVDNGGSTFTHALQAGSPAVDAIPVGINGCGTTNTTDQRGVIRPQGIRCDMGAFELQAGMTALCDLPPISVAGNCSGEVVVRSLADIDAYVASNFGRFRNAQGKLTYKNLRLLGAIGQHGMPMEVTSPCRIIVNANATLTGSDVNLHARMGMITNWSADIDASGQVCLISDKRSTLLNGGNVLSASALAIRGNQKAFVGIQSKLSVYGPVELVSTGSGDISQVKIGNKTTVIVDSFTMAADNKATLAFAANVTSTGKLDIATGNLVSSETLVDNRSSLQAGDDMTLTSGGKTHIDALTTVTAASNLEVSAKTTKDCTVAASASITYSRKTGNCAGKLP